MRPVRRALNVAVFYRIEVEVIDPTGQALMIANRVFPESPGPQIALSIAAITEPDALLAKTNGEIRLDHSPPHGVPVIALWQAKNCMQMIRQDNHGAEGERMFRTNPVYCRT